MGVITGNEEEQHRRWMALPPEERERRIEESQTQGVKERKLEARRKEMMEVMKKLPMKSFSELTLEEFGWLVYYFTNAFTIPLDFDEKTLQILQKIGVTIE